MEASELRIGNYVLDHGSVEKIQFGSDLDDILNKEPIPLTEDWLVKFGLKNKDIEINGKLFYLFTGKDDDGMPVCVLGMEDYFPVIYHVHQFQNIYHALTGEELTIKE